MVENALRFLSQQYSIDVSFFIELYQLKLRRFKHGTAKADVYSLLLTDGTFLLDKYSFEENRCRFGGCKSKANDAKERYALEREISYEKELVQDPNEECSCKIAQGTLVVVDSLSDLRKFDKTGLISEHIDVESINRNSGLFPLHILDNPNAIDSDSYYKINQFFIFCFLDLKNCSCHYYIANPVVSPGGPFCYSYFGLVDNLSYTQDYNNFKLSDLNGILLHFTKHTLDDLFFLYSRRHSRVFKLTDLVFYDGEPFVNDDPTPLDYIFLCSYSSFSYGKEPPRFWRNFLLSFCKSNRLFSRNLNLVVLNVRLFEGHSANAQASVYTIQTPSEEDLGSLSLLQGFRYTIAKGVNVYEHQYSFLEAIDSSAISKVVEELNLELITWRILPDLKIKNVTGLKVCIVGLGTLGCSVIRQLLSWGVERFVLVDMGYVNNSTRQSLYVHKDCHKNVSKVEAAKKMIIKIRPDVKLTMINMEIPMPGHQYDELHLFELIENTRSIVDSSDVMILTTDTKESRWLPSLLASQRNFNNEPCPLVISAGLGFDSFMVIRHSYKQFKGACYFCSDSEPLRDTITGRPFDEVCTVVKPGVTDICGSVVVELIVSLTQHPLHFAAEHGGKSCVGNTPHSIRFSLSDYKFSELYAEPSEFCICCSENVMFSLNVDQEIVKVFSDPAILLKHSNMDSIIEAAEKYKKEGADEEEFVVL
ncbi:autophagy protein [Theileria orientalis]|uniref:Autophagy protein n=1 Tax=Theileria orientalis TaxID=68886 RepID=A0A976MAJ7_THEOR|nr:autophagy protein [Theileria orientalis]